MTQVFIPESTVGVSLGFNQLVPMWLCIRGRISLSLASLGVGMWLARPKKRSKERCSVEALPEGSKLKLCSKQVSLVQVHFSDVMNDNWCLCESRNLVRRFKLIPIAGIEKKLDVAEHRTTQWDHQTEHQYPFSS